MPTTTPDGYPYPVSTQTPDVVRDIAALAARDQAILSGQLVPNMIRIRAAAAVTGFGQGVYTTNNWTTEYQRGASGAFTVNLGNVTVNQAGIYLMALNMTMTGTGARLEAKIVYTTGPKVLARGAGASDDNILSLSAGAIYLPAGAVVNSQALNFGTAAAGMPVDSNTDPNNFTVLQMPNSP